MILPIPQPGDEDSLATERAKLCGRCGYLHAIAEGGGPDLCVRCGAALEHPLTELLRLQNVATRRRDRISSDEEERRKIYEITDDGVRVVREWLLETEPGRTVRDEATLRTYFLWLLDPEQAQAYLLREAEHHEARLADYQRLAADATLGPAERARRVAIEASLRYELTLSQWARWASTQFDPSEVDDSPPGSASGKTLPNRSSLVAAEHRAQRPEDPMPRERLTSEWGGTKVVCKSSPRGLSWRTGERDRPIGPYALRIAVLPSEREEQLDHRTGTRCSAHENLAGTWRGGGL